MRKKKDKYSDLSPTFIEEALGMDREEIRERIARIALAQAEMDEVEREDQDLAEKKEAVKEAGAGYREHRKFSKLKIDYLRGCLDSKGGLSEDDGTRISISSNVGGKEVKSGKMTISEFHNRVETLKNQVLANTSDE